MLEEFIEAKQFLKSIRVDKEVLYQLCIMGHLVLIHYL